METVHVALEGLLYGEPNSSKIPLRKRYLFRVWYLTCLEFEIIFWDRVTYEEFEKLVFEKEMQVWSLMHAGYSYMSQDTSFMSWYTFRLLWGTFCLPGDTCCKSQDTSVGHGIFFLCLIILYVYRRILFLCYGILLAWLILMQVNMKGR